METSGSRFFASARSAAPSITGMLKSETMTEKGPFVSIFSKASSGPVAT